MFKALYEVVSKAGSNMNESSRNAILGLIDGDTEEADGRTKPTLNKTVSDFAQTPLRSRMLVSLAL